MKRWPAKPLGEIAEVRWGNTSLTKASYVAEGFAAFSATGEDGFLPSYEHEEDGIVLSAIGANCGKCFLARGRWTAIKNTITITITAKVLCTIRYLFYFLNNADLWPKRGGGQPFISQGDARKVIVPVAPLADQERIVKLLDEADELRKLRAQADRRTSDFIPALFHEMFGDPDSNPKNWQLVKVKDVARLINGRAFKPSEWGKNGLPIIRIQNLRGPETVFNYYDGDFEPKHLVEKDALLVSWAGQLVSFGVHIWPGPKGVLNQHIFKIEPFVECELHFLQHALAHLVERAKLQFQGSEMKHLTKGAIDEGKIFFPPLPLQKEFAARVSDIRAMQAEQAASRRRLDDLFQSMLHRAFQGEL